ncbi:hypothetical protein LGQ02_01260 [Bacillus shivajii]|uniref:hypothetical protein n=1 Tax=Bacillus shivajii TaxID=1983719 RepID=UPI001CF9D992|nr:hypothetical protein [Bacillus shivajii]UCZ53458.1 hypothetical protein LGQ02_01260 [Bacillus shivajii]
MSVNREELKRMIDQIPEEEALEVFDFISYLKLKREKKALDQSDLDTLSEDESLIKQVTKSRQERQKGQVYTKNQGLMYLREKVDNIERE